MSSTNKTTNYELSQFLGTDKPAWISDYNSDMTKIDTGIHTAQTTATGADGKADANTTAIGTLASLETTAKTNLVAAVNEVNTAAGTAQGTANDAALAASSAGTKVDKVISQFNFTETTYGQNDLTFTNFTYSGGDLRLSINNDSSLFKVYGSLIGAVVAGQQVTIKIQNATITTASDYDLIDMGYYQSPDKSLQDIYGTVKNGEIDIKFTPGFTGGVILHLNPFLYVNKNFSDVI